MGDILEQKGSKSLFFLQFALIKSLILDKECKKNGYNYKSLKGFRNFDYCITLSCDCRKGTMCQ